jgi:hypothetical protein
MDDVSHDALVCAPTGWLSRLLAVKEMVASPGSTIPICLFYMAEICLRLAIILAEKLATRTLTCRLYLRFHG